LLKEKNGIQVYVTDKDSANVQSIKTVAQINGTYQKIISLFLDVDKQTQWVYATKQAFVIEKMSENELLYYVETSLPWPVSNRDAAIRMNIRQNTAGDVLRITTIGEPARYAQQKGKVRIPYFNGDWQIKEVGDNKLRIAYLLSIDSGADIPPKILNLFIAKGPIETFTKLSAILSN
jgi:hypothetical protein